MKPVYTLARANRALPLLQAIATEVIERRALRRQMDRQRCELEQVQTPEGLRGELAELDARIYDQDEGLRQSRLELEELGMTVLRMNPLTVHIPGQSRSGPVVFCWQEGEDHVGYGHPIGEEEDARRPLRLKT